MRGCFIAAVVVVVTANQVGTAFAQPLITDPNLIFYFPFENGDFTGVAPGPNDPTLGTFVGVLSDQSGNGFDGDVYTPDPASTTGGTFSFEIDTTNSARGGGSAKFVQSDFAATDGAVDVNLRGEDLNANNFSKTVAATNSATYAAWINTTTNSVTDQAFSRDAAMPPAAEAVMAAPISSSRRMASCEPRCEILRGTIPSMRRKFSSTAARLLVTPTPLTRGSTMQRPTIAAPILGPCTTMP